MSSSSSARSRHTTPASSARASPYIFDQFTNTVACLKPSIPTYYSETSCSSRTSTLSRNRSNTGSIHTSRPDMQHTLDSHKLRKALSSKINIDNVAYYQSGNDNNRNGNVLNQNESPSKIKWNFFGDIKRNQQQQAEARKRENQRKHHRSAQNINTVSIWHAENDERNAIIFHHESGIVENCSGNYLGFLSPETSTLTKTKSSENISKNPPLNNTLCEQSKTPSGSLNMQRNVFSRSSSNIYDITTDFRIFQKQSNLYRNSINLSQNYLSSLSSSMSSLDDARANNPNLKSKVLNAPRECNGHTSLNNYPTNRLYCSYDQGFELENLNSSNSTENIK